jgi:hypothetical protein
VEKKDNYPDLIGGNEPGIRTRRRGALPTATADVPAPLSLTPTQAPSPANTDDLAMTQKVVVPPAKVLALRMSEEHHKVARTMLSALSGRYELDQRQVGELLVQFLVQRRHDLDEFVSQQVGPSINDFFQK